LPYEDAKKELPFGELIDVFLAEAVSVEFSYEERVVSGG
jgi:hypothetical protein